MPIKESSDELNPTVPSTASVPHAKSARSATDYFALAIATCGVGYLPLAPGTWGSLVGIVVFAATRAVLTKIFFAAAPTRFTLLDVYYAVCAFEFVVLAGITFLGTWAASRTEKLSGKKDPGKVVVDEVAGQFIALMPGPYLLGIAWWAALLAFVLFRFFDIVKPYPARKLESLPAGLGIMADDLVAGVYAAVVLMVIVSITSVLF